MKQWIYGVVSALVIFVAGIAVFLGSGAYDVAADTPHWALTERLLEWTRSRSIAQASASVRVPRLDAPGLRIEGARHYAEMCAQCHLAPGMDESELRAGLNPRPPDFTRHAVEPAKAFWIVKHGIKMSGMPAWGETHDDHKLWSIVALLQALPHTNEEQYRQWSGSAAEGAVPSGDSHAHDGD